MAGKPLQQLEMPCWPVVHWLVALPAYAVHVEGFQRHHRCSLLPAFPCAWRPNSSYPGRLEELDQSVVPLPGAGHWSGNMQTGRLEAQTCHMFIQKSKHHSLKEHVNILSVNYFWLLSFYNDLCNGFLPLLNSHRKRKSYQYSWDFKRSIPSRKAKLFVKLFLTLAPGQSLFPLCVKIMAQFGSEEFYVWSQALYLLLCLTCKAIVPHMRNWLG